MAEIFKKYRNILLLILLGLGAWWGYSSFFGGAAPAPDLVAESKATSEVGKDLLDLLLESNTIKLDSAIFQNDIFGRLQDFGKPIPPETAGRPNPFAPLAGSDTGDKESGPAISVSVGAKASR